VYEKAELSVYEVGHDKANMHSIHGAHDMTTEAAVTKLMWVLGDRERRTQLLTKSLCHEMIDPEER
jgi:L-asparaginase